MTARHRDDTARPRWGVAVAVVVGLAIVAGLALVGFKALREVDDRPAASCDKQHVSIVVTPEMDGPVRQAAKTLADSGGDCIGLEVTAARSADVAAGKLAAGLPMLWLPDSSAWLGRMSANMPRPTPVTASVASTPVVLTSGHDTPAPPSWLEALGSGAVGVTDPLTSSTGAAALLSVQAERRATHATDEQIGGVIVPAAQNYGARPKPITATAEAFEAVTAAGSQVLGVATEQAFLTYVGEHAATSVVAVAPQTGAVSLDYPLVTFVHDPAAKRAGEALAAYLSSARGQDVLRAAWFRGVEGAALPGGVGVGDVPKLRVPADPKEVERTLHTWAVLTVPSRILAVIDVSGSMDQRAGRRTRIELTVEAASTGLAMFSKSASIGAWAFSDSTLGNGGKPYRSLAAIRGLDDEVGGGTQRDRLRAAIQGLPAVTTGGTALYDTTLAAIRGIQKDYDPAAVQSVVLLTDGADDGSSKIGRSELISTLKREFDPQRPVRVIAIGISPDADMGALQDIAAATHGRAYSALDPNDIHDVFIQSFLQR